MEKYTLNLHYELSYPALEISPEGIQEIKDHGILTLLFTAQEFLDHINDPDTPDFNTDKPFIVYHGDEAELMRYHEMETIEKTIKVACHTFRQDNQTLATYFGDALNEALQNFKAPVKKPAKKSDGD